MFRDVSRVGRLDLFISSWQQELVEYVLQVKALPVLARVAAEEEERTVS